MKWCLAVCRERGALGGKDVRAPVLPVDEGISNSLGNGAGLRVGRGPPEPGSMISLVSHASPSRLSCRASLVSRWVWWSRIPIGP